MSDQPADGTAYTWIGNTSRDEYLGVFFGLCVAYDMIGDAPTRAQIAALITRMLDNLVDHVWTVVMANLSVSTTFVARPDQQLTLLQIGRHVNSKYNAAYSALAVLAPSVIAPISIDCTDTHGSYFKFNLDYISFYHLIGLETSSFRKLFYTKAYGILRTATGTHLNAHFDAIDRSIRGANAGRDYDTRTFLDQWLTRPGATLKWILSASIHPADHRVRRRIVRSRSRRVFPPIFFGSATRFSSPAVVVERSKAPGSTIFSPIGWPAITALKHNDQKMLAPACGDGS
jgi:hypothetical protein